MAKMKVADVAKTAALLKQVLTKVDTNQDGAIRAGELAAIGPAVTRATPKADQFELRFAVRGAQLFAMHKTNVSIPNIKKAIDEIAKRVKAGDKDGDGKISETEYDRLSTGAERDFVVFGEKFSHAKVSDFHFAAPHAHTPPHFSWTGTIPEVTSSLLNAFSKPGNDNFWPYWATHQPGASRYVLDGSEAKAMVKALQPLYATRQKGVIEELAKRTHNSSFGCVSVTPAARTVLENFAHSLGVNGLQFDAVPPPAMPSPS
jgi:hypothetical protein